MADINVERKGPSIWPWIVGVLVLALLIWAIAEMVDTDEPEVAEVVEPVEPVPPAAAPEPLAEAPAVSIPDILRNPAAYVGRGFRGEVRVVAVPTDRGFWIEDQGQRLFAVIVDQPQEEPKDINPGQVLRITGGTLRDRTFLPQIPGAPLDAETRNIAQQQPLFLVVDERNIEILQAGRPQPGTDPAQRVQPPAGAPGTEGQGR